VSSNEERDSPSLEWIHRIREAHYERTKGLPLESWLKAPDPQKLVDDCRKLGLRVRVTPGRERKTVSK
jgi:hypothetical protein